MEIKWLPFICIIKLNEVCCLDSCHLESDFVFRDYLLPSHGD